MSTRTGGSRNHIVCRGCGRTAAVDCLGGEAPRPAPAEAGGFVVDAAEIVFWGVCPSCGTQTPATEQRPR